MTKKIPNNLDTQYASSFSSFFTQFDEAWKATDVSLEEYNKMLKDESVSAALDLLTRFTRKKIGSYIHEDPEITEFVNRNFENLDEGFIQIIDKLIRNMYAFGYGVGEIVWEPVGDKLIISKIIVLDSAKVSFVLGKKKKSNKYITHIRYYGSLQKIDIPIEKCILIQRDIGPDGFGRSLLRRAYRPYKFKEMLFKYWALAMERYAAPILYGKTVGDPQKMAEVLKEVWRNGVIAVFNEDEVGVIQPSGDVGKTFRDAISYANTLIFRALLVPQLLMKQENIGTYSLAQVHLNVFNNLISEEAKQIGDKLIDQLVTKILYYNFLNVDSYGSFVAQEEMSVDNMKSLAEIFVQLVGAGIIDPVLDNDYIRKTLKIPKVEE